MSTDFGTVPPSAPRSGKTNTLAIVAVVCVVIGIVMSFCCGLFGIPVDLAALVCGGIALSQINRTRENGRGMAIAGLALGGLGIVLSIVMMMLGAAIQGLPQFQQFQQQIEQQENGLNTPAYEADNLGEAADSAPEADGTVEEDTTTE